MNKEAEFFGDTDVKQKVELLWNKVFESSNRVLHQSKLYGYNGIEIIPSPNIHQILVTLQMLGAIIDVLYSNSESVGLEYEQQRQLLNARSQITNMEQVAAALKAGNREDYEQAVSILERQTVI